MTISAEEITKAKAAYEALSPVARAIHDLEQRRSGARGLVSFNSDVTAVNAAIDARPEYVILAAYREAVASLTNMKAEIERLSILNTFKCAADCQHEQDLLRARIAALEAQLAGRDAKENPNG